MRRFDILPAPRPVTYNGVSYPYVVTAKGVVINNDNHTMAAHKSNGYLTVSLRAKGANRSAAINRIVALAFVNNSDPATKKVVDHIDGDKLNNHYKNLRWVTQKENCQFAVDKNGHRGGTKKVKVDQLDMKGNFIARFDSMADASEATGANRRGIRLTHTGYQKHCNYFKWFVYENNEEIVTDGEIAEMRRVPIEGYEDYYISRSGRVVTTKNSRQFWRYMKIKVDENGYSIIQFSKLKMTENFRVHTLVALCYLPTPRPDQTQVNHKNKRRSDNRLENLEWVSPSENMRHAFTYREEATID